MHEVCDSRAHVDVFNSLCFLSWSLCAGVIISLYVCSLDTRRAICSFQVITPRYENSAAVTSGTDHQETTRVY